MLNWVLVRNEQWFLLCRVIYRLPKPNTTSNYLKLIQLKLKEALKHQMFVAQQIKITNGFANTGIYKLNAGNAFRKQSVN